MGVAVVFMIVMMLPGASLYAQNAPRAVEVNSELERYLRVLNVSGIAPWSQWTIRPFGPREMPTSGAAHPWRSTDPAPRRRWNAFASASLAINSGFPYGFNDGPVWTGRGATLALHGGGQFAARIFSAALVPTAFMAQNAPFPLGSTGSSGPLEFANYSSPSVIDLPQRFGNEMYRRIDPGESFARLDWKSLAAGVSTAAEWWGPAIEHPLILGNNAGGLPRLFAGTASPIGMGPVKIRGRIFWGAADASAYSPGGKRYTTGGVGGLSFGSSPAVEIGGARFFHAVWPADGFFHGPWLSVVEEIFKNRLSVDTLTGGTRGDNQMASLFVRLSAPPAGLEFYAEYGREDHNADLRDFLKEPDHDAAYLLGFMKTLRRDRDDGILAIHGEVANSRISHLAQTATQVPWYIHSLLQAGHTLRGQALGSAALYGGGGVAVAIDRYSPKGRTSIRWDRLAQAELMGGMPLPDPARADVMHALSVEQMRFRAKWQVTGKFGIAKDFNRNFAEDAYNAFVGLSVEHR
jgi:hypothetical protein